jgi:hypothetical protein
MIPKICDKINEIKRGVFFRINEQPLWKELSPIMGEPSIKNKRKSPDFVRTRMLLEQMTGIGPA